MKYLFKMITLLLLSLAVLYLLFSIPVEKYQKKYFAVVKQIQNKPQEHLDRQYKYAQDFEKYGTFYPEVKEVNTSKEAKPATNLEQTNERVHYKPLYIRDKNNPNILHPYKEKKRKLFF